MLDCGKMPIVFISSSVFIYKSTVQYTKEELDIQQVFVLINSFYGYVITSPALAKFLPNFFFLIINQTVLLMQCHTHDMISKGECNANKCV